VSGTAIDNAVRILRAGGLVAFPTETVYGLGADAANPRAVRRIFEAKGRPADHPLIVHLASAEQLSRWARQIPPAVWVLAQRFWPGPLTLILRRAAGVLDEVTGGQDTVGLRVPAHPVAQALLQAFRGGIAAPSANRFGRISPTTAPHVRDELGDRVDLILDGGACPVGIESTILDLSSGTPILLRPGHVGSAELEVALGMPVSRPTGAAPRASGTLAAHYAPSTPLLLVASPDLAATVRNESARGSVAVLAWHPRPAGVEAQIWSVAPAESDEYARMLYATLRELDQSGCAVIIVEAPPQAPEWLAVHDRLHRSAAGSTVDSTDDTP
jgi:L-threonylcarbamoyladenylate synthase